MSDYDGTDDIEEDREDFPAPAADSFLTAIALCQVAERPKPIASALKKLRKLGRAIAAAEQKLAALTARTEQAEAEFAARAAALDEREHALDARAVEFEASLAEAHAALRASHENLSEVDKRIRYRILSSANLLHGFNERLQDLPDWRAIKQMIPGLPDDPPTASPAEVVSENMREDWAGNIFVPGSTLTRTIKEI